MMRWLPLVALAAITAPSMAQDIGPALNPGLMVSFAGAAAVTYDNEQRSQGAGSASRSPFAYAPSGSVSAQASKASFSYDTSDQLARDSVKSYIQRAARTQPEGARVVGDQLARHDYRQIYRGLIAGTGLRENDAADAVTAYTALGWLIVNNQLGNPDPRAIRAFRAQVATRALGNAAYAPDNRARLGEEMKLLFVTLHSGWQAAQREGNVRQYSDGVAAMFAKQTGNDLRALRLTGRGLVKG